MGNASTPVGDTGGLGVDCADFLCVCAIVWVFPGSMVRVDNCLG